MAPSKPLEARGLSRGALPGLPAPAFDTDAGVLVTFGFRCNLACTFCMVEDVLDRYEGASLDQMRQKLRDPTFMRGAGRVVLSGGEATLEKNLLEYVRAAREIPQVRHVRVQTNGTRLANRGYLKSLLEAGVDEFFVSLHGHDVETCDALTQKKGSFRAILAGIEAIAESGAALYTNTVVWRRSYRHLSDIVALVAPYGPLGMEFWNLWPRVDPHDHREHLVPVGDSAPHLRAALAEALARGIQPRVKFYPRCMLDEYGHLVDDSQPNVLVEPTYWEAAPRYACIHQNDCRHSPNGCSGLSFTYIRKYGWEEELLTPEPLTPEERATREEEGPRTAAAASMSELDAGVPVDAQQPHLAAFCARLGLEPGAAFEGWVLETPTASGQGLRLPLHRGGDAFVAHLAPGDPNRRVFARTKSFDLSHGPVPETLETAVAQPMRALKDHLEARDPGGLSIPPPGSGATAPSDAAGSPAPATAGERAQLGGGMPPDDGERFVQRATGVERAHDPGFLAVLDAVRALLEGAAAPTRRSVALDLETSVRASTSGLEPRRYLVQLPLDGLGADAPGALGRLLDGLEAPAGVFDGLGRLARTPVPANPAAVHLMLGCEWDDDPARRTRRLYVERRGRPAAEWGEFDERTDLPGRLSAIAWEWVPGHVDTMRVRRYFDVPEAADPVALLDAQFGPELTARVEPPLRRLLEGRRLVYAYRRADVDDRNGRSEAVQFILAPCDLAESGAALLEIAQALGVPVEPLRGWVGRLSPALLRVVGIGRTRDGRWHLTPYVRAAGTMTTAR